MQKAISLESSGRAFQSEKTLSCSERFDDVLRLVNSKLIIKFSSCKQFLAVLLICVTQRSAPNVYLASFVLGLFAFHFAFVETCQRPFRVIQMHFVVPQKVVKFVVNVYLISPSKTLIISHSVEIYNLAVVGAEECLGPSFTCQLEARCDGQRRRNGKICISNASAIKLLLSSPNQN